MDELINRRERFRGSLLGMAIGDALGAPLNGMKPGHVLQIYGAIDGFVDAELAWKGKPHRWSLRGLYTGTTQRALVVADILAAEGHCDPRALVEVFVEMANAKIENARGGCHRRTSYNARKAIERMVEGETAPLNCGEPSPDTGVAASAAPLGLFYAEAPDSLIQAAIETSLPTHRDPRAIAAAVCVASAVAHFVLADPDCRMSPTEVVDFLVEQVRKAEEVLQSSYRDHLPDFEDPRIFHHLSESIATLGRMLEEGDDTLAYESIVRQANRCGPEVPVREAGSGFAPAGLPTALYLALGGRSFLEAMPLAVTRGRESSDLGAMVGAIIGARDGVEAIPETWIAQLRNADQVRLRADDLERKNIDYSQWRGIVDMESEVAALESQERRRWTRLWEKQGLLQKKPRNPRPKKEPELGFSPPPEKWLNNKIRDRKRTKTLRKEKHRKR